nr:cuticle protein 18.6-like [Penaeus vannamei]
MINLVRSAHGITLIGIRAEHHSSLSFSATNMSVKLVLLAALAALASAVPRPDSPPVYHAPHPTYKQPGMPFDFSYAVKDPYSGNDYAHAQTSDGHVTSGSYSVALPDGRTEIVEFTADHDNGYVANVAYGRGLAALPKAPCSPNIRRQRKTFQAQASLNSRQRHKAEPGCFLCFSLITSTWKFIATLLTRPVHVFTRVVF